MCKELYDPRFNAHTQIIEKVANSIFTMYQKKMQMKGHRKIPLVQYQRAFEPS